ncbi:chorismate synthase [Aeribacillus composti]|jgi:hypothetical protein|uniref:Chorismate synthase n=1 Tax=Aeribacillus pallidus TaxID=33936 RepID=A0A223E1N3_9BACI|nr:MULTISPECIES: hypothetical protein [Aeribacillus]REJ23159.1 MAG: chorismate synthase [Bacillaceae bacterium]ASS89168.1 hypothetical protein AP3564_01790 [Aeribacillus pallidus]MDR9797189.1 chorismate synthase [Aeribacillus pallidus]MED0716594.1 chorismate synthase [Aeribacillus composti]MED0745957.1 chorismate synthase [Aeribacillus composti]
MFDWFKTATEKKRDDYHKLYEKLHDALSDYDQNVSEAEGIYESYVGKAAHLSSSDIPSNDFEPKRQELNQKLNKYFQLEKQKRSSLVSAKNKAYERYIYYKNLAIKEARERAEREERERKERMERLYGKR